MNVVGPSIRLSELRALLRERGQPRDGEDEFNPRMVRSILQSLAVEGYEFSEEAAREAGHRVLR
jgi:hypothetical protein